MGRILDDVDVDIATFQWIYASASIYRVLVLVNLDDIVQFVWAVLVPAKVIKIEPVRLAALACDNAPATRE